LRIVADAVRDRGFCILTWESRGAAGICVTTARNALRTAAREGLVTIEERRRDKRPNLPMWCGWCAGMEDVDRARPQRKSAKPPRRGEGRVQKNRGHG